ncbi:MAG TPA: hypothetical protein VFK05_13520 [Polyangiaceae bacterium]|nr:hypothetical protein [Polyangiaceae bacterium]
MAARLHPCHRGIRYGARGAILVEALIVIVALVLLLVAFLFMDRAFTLQLRVQNASRAAAFGFAMNGCEGGLPNGLRPEDAKLIESPATAPGGSQTVADVQVGQISEPAAASAFNQAAAKNTGFGMPAAASVSARGVVSATDGKETLSGTMHSRTTLLCNEKPREGTLDDAVEYIVDFLRF